MVFKALRADGRDPAAHLALEEALLSLPEDADPLLLLYINDPCVIVGRNQNPWAEVAKDCHLPVLRRVSGGGAVYHDRGNLNWALFVPRSLHDPAAELALVARALGRLGVETESGPRGGLFLAGDSPLAGGKLSGTARRFAAHRVLHHGTILVDADLERLRSSLGGIALRSSRAIASVPAHPLNLCSLRAGLGIEVLVEALTAVLGDGREPGEVRRLPGVHETAQRAAQARLRHASWEWVWGETPAFTVDASGPKGDLALEVRGGRVVGAEGPGAVCADRVLGRPFAYDLPARLAGGDA